MSEQPTTQEQDLKAEFDAARLAGDHARMAELGPRLWPDPPPIWPDPGWDSTALPVNERLASSIQDARARAAPPLGNATPSPAPPLTRAALEARVAELRTGPMLEPAFRRHARLAELEQAQRQLYEATEATPPADPFAQPALDELAKTDLTPEDLTKLREQGVAVIEWPDLPAGAEWDAPVADAVAAHLVDRGIAPADLTRWIGRGAALAQQEPAGADAASLDRAVVADAQFALRAYLPDPVMRARVFSFLEDTGLADDAAFIIELSAKGAPLRRELEQARAERGALRTMNQGSKDSAALQASIEARYKRIYGGG